jgi:hypothetical protein
VAVPADGRGQRISALLALTLFEHVLEDIGGAVVFSRGHGGGEDAHHSLEPQSPLYSPGVLPLDQCLSHEPLHQQHRAHRRPSPLLDLPQHQRLRLNHPHRHREGDQHEPSPLTVLVQRRRVQLLLLPREGLVGLAATCDGVLVLLELLQLELALAPLDRLNVRVMLFRTLLEKDNIKKS